MNYLIYMLAALLCLPSAGVDDDGNQQGVPLQEETSHPPVWERIPDILFNGAVVLRPSQWWNSRVMQHLLEDVDPELVGRFRDEFHDAIGIDIQQNRLLAIVVGVTEAIAQGTDRKPPNFIMFADGPFTEAAALKLLKTLFQAKPMEPVEHAGQTYIPLDLEHDDAVFALLMGEETMAAGLEYTVRKAMEATTGERDTLASDAELQRALKLVDQSATANFIVWGNTGLLNLAVNMLALRQEGEEHAEVLNDIATLEAFGLSVTFDRDLVITLKARFPENETADNLGVWIQGKRDELLAEEDLRTLMLAFRGTGSPEAIRELVASLEIGATGGVLTLEQSVPGESEFLENIRDAFLHGAGRAEQRARRAKTMANMRQLSNAVEMYSLDHYRVGSPKAADIDELVALLIDMEFLPPSDTDWTLDGWNNRLIYQADPEPGGRAYTLMSYGADAAPGPRNSNRADGTREDDLVLRSGEFVKQ